MDTSKVLGLLESIHPFPSRGFRKNIRQPGQAANPMGFAMGKVWKLDEGIYESKFNRKYPELWKALRDLANEYDSKFPWTSVQVNKNQQCALHRDRNNKGPSIIIGLGAYTGGQLAVVDDITGREKVYATRNNFVRFDGNQAHYTKPFRGTRYTLVYFAMDEERSQKTDPSVLYRTWKTRGGLAITYRQGTSDFKAVREVGSYERNPLFAIAPGDVWLDLGGHIGYFALLALNKGAAKVVSAEPEPQNVALFNRNKRQNGFGKDKILLYPAACVAGKNTEGKVVLYTTPGSTSNHTLVPGTGNAGTVRVASVTLRDLLRTHPDTNAVKMNVEGSECDLIRSVSWSKDTRVQKLVIKYSLDRFPDTSRFHSLIEFLKGHFKTVFVRESMIWCTS